MKEIKINTKSNYKAIIEQGVINKLDFYINENIKFNEHTKVVIITDSNVYGLLASNIKECFSKMKLEQYTFIIKAGEKNKKLNTVNKIYKFLISKKIDRNSFIVALGGGVVGDIAGFVSSTYLRGIDYIQIPTTLLAQVDSSIGGKTAVNMKMSKNAVGTIWQPKLVIIDTKVLETLNDLHKRNAIAEIIKYGCIKSNTLFNKVLSGDLKKDIEDIIFECVQIKKDIVEEDERDNKQRKLLNFGHTFGHALEATYNYKKYTHGEAVSIGMMVECKMGIKLGVTNKDEEKILRQALVKHKLNVDYKGPIKINKIVEHALNDKKSFGEYIEFALLKNIGEGVLYNIKKEELIDLFSFGVDV